MLRNNDALADLVAQATEHGQAGRLAEACAAYRAALVQVPNNPGVLHNLGVVTAAQGDHRSALTYFDAALAVEPRYASAHYNRGVALQALGASQEAIKAYSRATFIEPGHYDAHRAIAFALLAAGLRDRALDHFARTYELRRGDDRNGMAVRSLNDSNRSKLEHDAQQFHYIAGTGREPRRFEALARSYATIARDFQHSPREISRDDRELLGDSYNTAIHVADAPAIAPRAVNEPKDPDKLAEVLAAQGAVCLDELLTPAALTGLRRYLLASTIWHDFTHIEGFVASYLEDGLACPLLLQIVDEARGALPQLLHARPLKQAWAFKAVRPEAAVDVHVDDGDISINFWITPTAANQNAGHGGLEVCLEPPPPEWQMSAYDSDRQRASDFLGRNRDRTLVVPYAENRAVIFASRLAHRSDAPRFAPGYENQRINLTLVFAGSQDRPLFGTDPLK